LHIKLLANVVCDDYTYTDCFRKALGLKNVYMRLNNNELNDLYSSPDMVWVIKMQKNEMDGACSMYGGEQRCIQCLVGNLRERDHLEYPGIDGRIISRWIFRKWRVRAWTGLIWLRTGTGGGHL
jgi:hypothetical protein